MQDLHVGYVIKPADSTDAPEAPLIERILSPLDLVTVQVSEADRVIGLTQMSYSRSFVCSAAQDPPPHPPYVVKISLGSSGHITPSGDLKVAETQCADRGTEVGECRNSLDLLAVMSSITLLSMRVCVQQTIRPTTIL